MAGTGAARQLNQPPIVSAAGQGCAPVRTNVCVNAAAGSLLSGRGQSGSCAVSGASTPSGCAPPAFQVRSFPKLIWIPACARRFASWMLKNKVPDRAARGCRRHRKTRAGPRLAKALRVARVLRKRKQARHQGPPSGSVNGANSWQRPEAARTASCRRARLPRGPPRTI